MMASSTSKPRAMINAPSEILCRSMENTFMNKKVIASTSGMVSATTSPGRISKRNGFVCRPNATKLTASTISTASIRVWMNSLTDSVTARGWFDTWCSSMPTGSSLRMRCKVSSRPCPMSMMLPPFSIDTPRPITSWPLKRILSCGGSAYSRVTVAMSPSRTLVVPERNCSSSRFLMEASAPVTRTCRLSLGVTSTPVDSTAFCVLIWLTMASKVRPSWANLLREMVMFSFSSCTPNCSTLATSGTRSNCWRTKSA